MMNTMNMDFLKKTAVTGTQKTKEREYWLNKLSGNPVKSSFYKDFKEARPGKGKREKKIFKMTDEFFDRLMALRNGSDHRLHMILTAGLAILLSKHTGSSDIILGAPIYKQDIKGEFINTVLALRNRVAPHMTFKELLLQVRQTVFEAAEHQNYPVEILLDQLDIPFSGDEFPLFDVALLLENIHDVTYLGHIPLNMVFSFLRTDDALEGCVEYNAQWYDEPGIKRIVSQFTLLLQTAVFNVNMAVSEIPILSGQEKHRLLFDFSGVNAGGKPSSPGAKMVHQLFQQQAVENPDGIAVICTDPRAGGSWHIPLTYKELNGKANRLGNFLYSHLHVRPDERVGILMESSIDYVTAVLAVLKAGSAYVPIDPSLPDERKKHMIMDAGIRTVISQARYLRVLNRLQWECPAFHSFICLDGRDVYSTEDVESSELQDDKKLWEYVGETADDEITGGGWLTSYTAEPFTKEEMDEYGDNILKKLTPLLHNEKKVLEIGCASGISMYRIAPKTGLYYGIDLSETIIQKNRERVEKENHKNIRLACLPAHEIDTINEKNFHLVIINSVIQDFYGHNYLRSVINKAVNLMGEKGFLFIGDVMDQELKDDLVRELKEFKRKSAAEGKNVRTKTDWSSELFVSREFFEDLKVEMPVISKVAFSHKIHTIKNELTEFRFDCLITVDKTRTNTPKELKKHKYQYDSSVLDECGTGEPPSKAARHNLAYVIYTSGTTGIPNGVMIEHRNLSSSINWFTSHYDLKANPHLLQSANISFDVSVTEIFAALTQGATLYIAGRETLLDKERLLSYLKDHIINVVQFVPATFRAFLADEPAIDSLKLLISGGDVLDESLKNKLIAKGYNLYNQYGPTEATVDSTVCRCDETPVTIGKPITGAQAYIVDHTNHLQPVGVPGELLIGGNGLAREYLNNPQKTAEKFVPLSEAILSLPAEFLEKLANRTHENRVYRTGDMARWRDNGTIEFIGRKDHQVQIRGFRIEPGEIENHLKEHEHIEEAVVAAGTNEAGEGFLCAYIVWTGHPGDMEITEIRDYLSGTLPNYMIPSYFVMLDEVPLTPNGKVDRRKLPAVEAVNMGNGYTEPQDDIQKKLVDIWAEILKIDKSIIGIDENFFQLGGHSLKATVLVSIVHKELNVKVPLSEIFKSPTIRALSQYIKGAVETKYISLKPVKEKDYYKVSFAQKRLYAMHQLEPGTSYNTPQALLIEGNLDREKLEKTFQKLIKRHESLRTSFELQAEEPMQKIHPDVDFNIEFMDNVSDVKPVVKDFIRPFDLAQVPLMRVGLIKVEEKKHILVIDMHHIITDGVSEDIFVKDFAALYRGEELPPLRLQYKDYAEWQNSASHLETLKKQEEYWLKRFEDTIPVLDLPLDYPRPELQTFDGNLMPFPIPGELARQLKHFVEQEKEMTLYMVLSAVFNILLARYSGQDDLVVGFPITGRTHADLENILGMFVNLLPLRNRPASHKTFREFLQEVKTNALDAYANQDFPLNHLVEKLGIRRNPGKNPLFDCVFSFQELDAAENGDNPLDTDLKISPYNFESSTSKFDLQLRGMAGKEGIVMALEYKTALFKQATIEEMQKHFIEILEQVVENTDIKLEDIMFSSDLVFGVTVKETEQVDFNF